MDEILTIVAHARAKPGQESRALELLQGLIAPTRKEAGCIDYDLHQSIDDPSLFVFYENWATVKDFEAHGRSAHIQKFRQVLGEVLAEGPTISKWKIVP
ncbi:MAG: putative quinol monooxygenase [Candidatus Acidiferrales bacterium]